MKLLKQFWQWLTSREQVVQEEITSEYLNVRGFINLPRPVIPERRKKER